MDMYNNFPNLTHVVVTSFLTLFCIAMTAFTKGRVMTAFNVGFWLFLITTGILWYLMVSNHNVDAHIRQTESMTAWMEQFSSLDDAGREIMAAKFFPKIKYRLSDGHVREEFESTKVLIGLWKEFLDTSDAKYVSPKRDWVTKEKPPEAWDAIYTWLVKEGKVFPDSATGNHSYVWVGESYNHLSAQWRMAGRRLVDMNKVERIAERYDEQHNGIEAANDG